MKKLFIFLFVIFLFSCEKEEPCWTCQMTTEQTMEDTKTVLITKCDLTASEIFAFEEDNTWTRIERRDMGMLGVWVIITTKTTECKK